MPSSANTNSKSEKGSSYRPDYDVWNEETGTPTHQDNGDDYYSDSRDNGKNFTGDSSNGNDRNHEERSSSNDAIANRNAAVSSLRQAENSAASSQEQSYYTGNGRNPRLDNKKAKGKKKKVGALITILLALGGIGAFLGSSNSLLAPALSALTTSATQTNYTSYVLRTKYITKHMLNGTGAGATTTGWTGKVKYSRIPNYLRTRLDKNGIKVNGSGASTTLEWDGQNITADDFVNKFNTDVEFREAYTKAKRGRVANFFDDVADKIYKKLGLSRNIFSSYQQTGDIDTDNANYKSTLSEKFEGNVTNLNTHSEGDITETDADGNIVYETDADGNVRTDADGNPIPKTEHLDHTTADNATTGSDTATAIASTRSMIAKVAQSVGQVGSAVCTVMKVGSMIGIAAAAQELYQSIDYYMTQMESISKMQAGYGTESAINSFLNFMSTPATTNVSDFSGSKIDLIANQFSGLPSAPSELGTATESGAPTEGSGLLRMLADAHTTYESTKNYSFERVLSTMGGAFAMTAGTMRKCAGIDIANSIVSIAVTFASGGLAKIAASFLTSTIVNVVTSITVSAFFSFLIPTLADIFFGNAANLVGIPAGQTLAKGAAAANMQASRRGSAQAPSDSSAVYAFNHETKAVLAMEAEQDRLTHSPFDITNRNTFFGTIAYSLLPTITSTSTTSLASFLRSATSSLSSIVSHGVSADGEDSSYLTTQGDCPLLAEIGVVGDLYCSPIVTTDMHSEMIEMDPDDATFQEVLMDGNLRDCDAEGNCEIVPNSDLAYYISFCDNRDSPFGAIDQNILGAMQVGGDNQVVSTILNSIPIVSDFTNLINSGLDLANLEWANGQKCGNTAKNQEFWNSKGKYFQRYIEDQRILEQMGAYEDSKNPVTAYEEQYEAEYLKTHPEANTYLGYLSRISGLTPKNTETVLAFITYYSFIDQYNPDNRIAMTGHTSDVQNGEDIVASILQSYCHFENNQIIYNPIETQTTERKYITYYDIRNRSYIA